MSRSVVTADDLVLAVRMAVAVLRAVPAEAWRSPAGSLEWDRWETVEHLSDDLFSYAVQLGPADPDAGPDGLLQTLEATGALLVAMVRTASPQARSYHAFGNSDPEGFAAMGIVETLVHTHDVTDDLGLDWIPPAELCTGVLERLFPEAPASTDPWPALLWSTGRADLPGCPRPCTWRWDGTPRLRSVGELEADHAADQTEQQRDLDR